MDATGEIYLIADELRSIADLGLHYARKSADGHEPTLRFQNPSSSTCRIR